MWCELAHHLGKKGKVMNTLPPNMSNPSTDLLPPPPTQQAKNHHAVLWILGSIFTLFILLCVAISSSGSGDTSNTTVNPGAVATTHAITPTATAAVTPAAKPIIKAPTTKPLSLEQQNAIEAAQGYLDYTAFSRKGLIEQLHSNSGDGYPLKVATYAVDSLHINYNAQAVKAAKSYLAYSSFSRKGLIDQLSSNYGDGYTHAQAVYGVTKAGL
jgi:hypothetical protein